MVTHAAEEVVCGRHNQDSANMQSLGGRVHSKSKGTATPSASAGTKKLYLLSFGAQDVLFLRETLLALAAVLPYRAGMGAVQRGRSLAS